MPDNGGGLGLRQSEQQACGLIIGNRLGSGKGYIPGNQAPFKMGKCILVGIRGQRSVPGYRRVVHQFSDTG